MRRVPAASSDPMAGRDNAACPRRQQRPAVATTGGDDLRPAAVLASSGAAGRRAT